MTERVQVVVRIRPFIASDPPDAELNTVVLDDTHVSVGNHRVFTVDRVFAMEEESEVVYAERVAPLVDRFITGCNASVLAYGQTGTGKTYTVQTMLPLLLTQVLESADIHYGANLREGPTALQAQPLLRMQYVEVYGEAIHDLLEDPAARQDPTKPSKLRIVTATTTGATHVTSSSSSCCVVAGAVVKPICTIKEAAELVALGDARRATGATNVHAHSSRSHAVLTLFHPRYACRLDVVDLAGSERGKKTGNTGVRLQESISINSGLLALGNVIRALSRNHRIAAAAREANTHAVGGRVVGRRGDPLRPLLSLNAVGATRVEGSTSQHVPYRSSKLTRLLQDTLGGSSATLFIACVAPDSYNRDETLRTLQYCSLALHVLNEPVRQYDRLQRAQSRSRREHVQPADHSPSSSDDNDEGVANCRQEGRGVCGDSQMEQLENVRAAYALLQQQYDEQGEVLASIYESYAEAKERLEVWERELRTDETLLTQQIRVMQQLVQENQRLRHRLGKIKTGRGTTCHPGDARRRRNARGDIATADAADTHATSNLSNEVTALLHELLERHSAAHRSEAPHDADETSAVAGGPPPVSALSPYRHLNFKSGSLPRDSADAKNNNNSTDVDGGILDGGTQRPVEASTVTSEPVQSFIRSLLRQHGIIAGREAPYAAAAAAARLPASSSSNARHSEVADADDAVVLQLQKPRQKRSGTRHLSSSANDADHGDSSASPSPHGVWSQPLRSEGMVLWGEAKTTTTAAAAGSALLEHQVPEAEPHDRSRCSPPLKGSSTGAPERDVQLLQLAHEVLRYEEINTDLRNQVRLLQARLDDKSREAARLRLEVQDMKDVYSSLSAMTD
jgi:hypothetical protein